MTSSGCHDLSITACQVSVPGRFFRGGGRIERRLIPKGPLDGSVPCSCQDVTRTGSCSRLIRKLSFRSGSMRVTKSPKKDTNITAPNVPPFLHHLIIYGALIDTNSCIPEGFRHKVPLFARWGIPKPLARMQLVVCVGLGNVSRAARWAGTQGPWDRCSRGGGG